MLSTSQHFAALSQARSQRDASVFAFFASLRWPFAKAGHAVAAVK